MVKRIFGSLMLVFLATVSILAQIDYTKQIKNIPPGLTNLLSRGDRQPILFSADFEGTSVIPPPGWTVVGTATPSFETSTQAPNKLQSLKIVAAASNSGVQSIIFSAISGDTYSIQCSMKSDGIATTQCQLGFFDKNGVSVSTAQTTTLSTSWVTQTATGTVPATAVQLRINLICSTTTGTVWFDQVSVQKTNFPGNLVSTGTSTLSGPIVATGTDSGNQTVSGNKTFSGTNAFNLSNTFTGTGSFTGNMTMFPYNVNNILWVDGSHFTTLAGAMAACSTTNCIINDTVPETFSANPFASLPANTSVAVHLGRGTWVTNVSIIVANKSQIMGDGRGDPTSNGTVIQAGASFPATTAVVQLGPTPGPNFHVRADNMTIDCNNKATATGLLNSFSQEQSGVSHLLITNCPTSSLSVSTSAAQNSGPYNDLEILNTSACTNCAAGTVPVSIGNGVAYFRGIHGMTINSNGATSPTIALRIDTSGNFSDIHTEEVTSSIVIGSVSATSNVSIANVGCGPNITDCVKISNAFASQNIALTTIGANTGNIITDQILGNTLTSAGEGGQTAFYAIGNGSPPSLITSSVTPPRLVHQIATGAVTMTTALIAASSCGSVATATATGAVAGDVQAWSFAGSPGSGVLQLLTISQWVTANTVNFQYCNPTAGGITPGAATINFRVLRP